MTQRLLSNEEARKLEMKLFLKRLKKWRKGRRLREIEIRRINNVTIRSSDYSGIVMFNPIPSYLPIINKGSFINRI